MGNPFSKIIQNGVEYDVSPYTHKIVGKSTTSETVSTVLSRMRAELLTKVSDFKNIKCAELHFYQPADSFPRMIYYLAQVESDNNLRLGSIYWTNGGICINGVNMGSTCELGMFTAFRSGTHDNTNLSNLHLGINDELVLYYT